MSSDSTLILFEAALLSHMLPYLCTKLSCHRRGFDQVGAIKQTPVINEYTGELVEKCATVKDPLSDLAIDITRQCIHVSLFRDGKEEVCPPLLSFRALTMCVNVARSTRIQETVIHTCS